MAGRSLLGREMSPYFVNFAKKIFNMKQLVFGLFSIALFASIGCNTEPQLDIDLEKIQKYLADNGLDAESTESGLHYIIEEPGTGEDSPNLSSEITINYKGYLLNGTVFDERDNQTFRLNQLIKGWQEGIQLMKPGGKAMLLIPSELGYGPGAVGSIPPNSVLLFDIELLSFN